MFSNSNLKTIDSFVRVLRFVLFSIRKVFTCTSVAWNSVNGLLLSLGVCGSFLFWSILRHSTRYEEALSSVDCISRNPTLLYNPAADIAFVSVPLCFIISPYPSCSREFTNSSGAYDLREGHADGHVTRLNLGFSYIGCGYIEDEV